jgi:hypothetical protein
MKSNKMKTKDTTLHFQKSYSLDTTNHSALYGIAYTHMENNPEKAIQLFLQFVDQAPVCDKQYPMKTNDTTLHFNDSLRVDLNSSISSLSGMSTEGRKGNLFFSASSEFCWSAVRG